MAGIKEKISSTMDKLTHRSHTSANPEHGTGQLHNTHQTTTGTGAGTAAGTGSEYGTTSGTDTGGAAQSLGHTTTTTGTGEIIDQERFTKTDDHEVLVEKKVYEKEHRPVQKEYVVETKYVGEKAVPGAPTEVVGSETNEIDERTVQAPAGDRTVVVENVDIPAGAQRKTTGGAGTY